MKTYPIMTYDLLSYHLDHVVEPLIVRNQPSFSQLYIIWCIKQNDG